jgi:hypothetical protein
VALELAAHPSVVRRQGRADILRVEELRLPGRADQVGEEDRHNLALLEEQLRGRVERRAAAGAEGNAVRALPPAGRADDHFRITVEAFPRLPKRSNLLRLGEPWPTKKAAIAGLSLSPFPDSNRRPPPYHLLRRFF